MRRGEERHLTLVATAAAEPRAEPLADPSGTLGSGGDVRDITDRIARGEAALIRAVAKAAAHA